MAVRPLKRTGFSQGLYQISSTAKEKLGTLRITRDGRMFRYGRAGATALIAGECSAAPAIAADVMNEACASAHAIGEMQVTETITAAAAAYGEDHFQGGYLQINDATGEGHQYLIENSTAVAVGGTAITLGLAEAIRVALVASTSEFTIAKSIWQGLTITTTDENLCAGNHIVPVTATYYCWVQTHGPGLYMAEDASAVGTVLVLDDTKAGNLASIATPLDIDVCYQVAVAWGTAGANDEKKPCFYTID
jgi:hypothetical protein